MALSAAELARIKAELGFNLLTSAAAPWVNTVAYFETIVSNYLTPGTSTTSATAVIASTSPAPVTLVLASAIGFSTGDRVWVDVDDRLESATIQSLSGANATIALKNAHAGTYPVSLDGGEAIVREYLARIKAAKDELGATFGEGVLKKVDEVEFYSTGSTLFGSTAKVLMYWRDELAAILGTVNMWRNRPGMGSGSTVAMY